MNGNGECSIIDASLGRSVLAQVDWLCLKVWTL